MSSSTAPSPPTSSIITNTDYLSITPSALENINVTDLVRDETAGGIATFIGITRNTFHDKKVVSLEYECYVEMALKEMQNLVVGIRNRWTVKKIAIVHRVGMVQVKEASVYIAISSGHRKECLEAVEFAINELKAKVPIWKKEIYDDNQTEWKKNTEYHPENLINKTQVN